MTVKAVDLLHEALRPVAGKGVADFLRAYEADADIFPPGFHQVEEPGPVAETFTGTINSTVIPVLSDTGGTGKTVVLLGPLFL